MFRSVPIEEIEAYLSLIEKVKDAEEAIQRLELPFKGVLDNMPMGLYISDELRKPVYVNNLAYSFMKHLLEPNVHPETLSERFNLYIPGTNTFFPVDELPAGRVFKSLKQEDVDGIEFRSDKRSMFLSMSSYPIFKDNKLRYVATLFWDQHTVRILPNEDF